MDSRCSPQPVRSTHLANQVANRDSHRRSSRPPARLPRPIASERAPMPADDRVGLQDAEPGRHSRHTQDHKIQRNRSVCLRRRRLGALR